MEERRRQKERSSPLPNRRVVAPCHREATEQHASSPQLEESRVAVFLAFAGEA
ncbi:uncharacterized protein DS421_20g679720 [Arachis hypogaea]|nr:uncharacterized protein DS421_20g679720 [Arachis hypogaea]